MFFKGQQYLIVLLSLFLFIYKNFKRKELFVLALFKVFKGAAQGLNSQALSDGYCWFTYDDGKFYIDYKDPTDQQLKRKALNANMADSDKFGDLINETYAVNLELTSNNLDNILTLYSKNDIVLATVSLSKPIFIINFYDSIGDADYDGNNRFRLITDPQDLANAIDKYADGDCILQCAVQDIDTIEVYNNHYIFTLPQFMHLFYTIVFPDISDLTHVVYKYFGFIGSNPTNSQIQRGEISLASGEDFESFQNFLLVELQNLAGTGLTLENKAVGDYTVSVLNHSNSVTANASYPTGTAVSANGGKITVRDIKYDAQGHITGSQDREITLSQTTYTVGNKALKVASNSGTATQAITVNENSSDRTLTVSGDGTYITGAVSGSSNAATITLSHATPSGLAAGSYGNSSNQTPGYGSTFNVPYITVDAGGHITAISNKTVKIPASNNTNTTYTLSGALSSDNKTFVTTLTPSSGNATTATVPAMTGASDSAAGKAGLVPFPSAGERTKFLRGDGTWQTAYTLPIAATDALGGIKIGTGLDITSSGVVSVDISDLGLSSAMHFIGVTETEIEDGSVHKDSYAGISNYTKETPGDVILYGDAEFVWTGNYWELLGDKGSFKIKQTAIENSTGTADGDNTSTSFIYSISQNANGEISAISRNLPAYPTKSSWNYDDVYVKYSASQSLTAAQKTQARSNIGAGTSNLTLGTSSSTAYRGDYGNIAYTHATDSSRLTTATTSGLYKIAVTAEGHVASVTAITKADITGLGIPAQDTTYSLPLAADGTRGGIQIGYTENGKNYPVELSNEKAYVNVPWTDTNTKVNVVERGTTKAYLLADTTAPTSTAAAHTAVAETSVYLDTTAGKLVATSFSGNGSALTNLNASNIASGTLAFANLPALYWANVAISNSKSTDTNPSFKTVTISSTTGANHINFSRAGYNYLNIPTDGALAVSVNGASGDNIRLAINDTSVHSYTNNSVTLGTSSIRWKALYVGSAASYGGATTAPIYWNNGVPAAVTDISLVKSGTSGSSINVGNENGSVKIFASLNRGLYDTTNSKWIVNTTTAGDHTYIPLWASKGASNQPVYFNASGEPVAISYTIKSNVPANAEFTDTTYSTLTQDLIDTGTETTGKLITAKLVKDNNTKVTQTVVTDNAEYAILAKAVTAVTTVTDTSKFAANVKLNPSLARLTATQIAYGVSGTAKAYTSYDSTDDSINFNFI